jgi:hypothetical protein
MFFLRFSRSWFSFRPFNELLQLRADYRSPAGFKILPRIRWGF